MLFNELPIVFPWYEKLEMQNRYNENTETICDYQLISPRDALLPFQFARLTVGGALPSLWEIREINTNNLVVTLTSQTALLTRTVRASKEYITYFGGAAISGLNLSTGYYYSRMTFPDGLSYYSEMFYVPPSSFTVATISIPYLTFVWYNNNDLVPIFYNDKDTNSIPKFKNVLYLDSFITASEPEIIEDGARDGNDELIPTFQKMLITYRITAPVPDFLKKAIMLMQLHDYVLLTTKNNVRSGTLTTMKIASNLEASGALSIVDIQFQETVLLKKGCGENMV